MDSLSGSTPGPFRFVSCTLGVFLLMLMPSVVGVACHAGWLPMTLLDVLMSASISSAVVGSRYLFTRLFENR